MIGRLWKNHLKSSLGINEKRLNFNENKTSGVKKEDFHG
jgi:hypothetical protein